MDKLRVSTFGRGAAHEAAVSMGIYAAEDLEVERDVTNSSKVQMQQLIDGVWHAVHTNADNVVWWNEDNGADLVIVLAGLGEELTARIADIAGAVELADIPRRFGANAIGSRHEVTVRHRVRRLL